MKTIAIILLSLTVLGCQCPLETAARKNKPTLAKINNYEISKEEFEEEFQESVFSRTDTQESRKEFLENLINRKLIMQDAQSQGLDKQKSFLRMIEKFWEQSLLTIAIDKKIKDISAAVFVNDKEVEEAYNKLPVEKKADKTYDQLYSQIKWELTRGKQSQMIDSWIGQLRKTANIEINYELLNKK